MKCPLCRSRSARRSCPALEQTICPVCCGTKRLVDIACPDTCAYLGSSKTHPPAAVRRRQQQDIAALAPSMAGLTEPQQQLLLLAITLVDRFRGDGLDAAADADVADAATALADTYGTAARGLIYEQRPSSVAAQRLAAAMRSVLEDLGRDRPSAFAADAAAALGRVEVQVRACAKAEPDNPRAFLDLAARIARLLKGDARPPGDVPATPPTSPIIMP